MIFGVSIFWILLAVVVYMVLGALWYSPVLFAGAWMKELGKKKADLMGGSPFTYMIPALGAAIITLTLAYLGQSLGLTGWVNGAMLGFQMWFAFAATTSLTNRVFQGNSMRLFAIDLGYHLAGFVLAGAIVLH